MSDTPVQNIFIQGAIPADFILDILQQHSQNFQIGAYSIFMGQVRGDEISNSRVTSVEFTTQSQMSLKKYTEIRSDLFNQYPLTDLLAYHSVGKVSAGEICFFVLAASPHRAEAIRACSAAVERIKSELAIWGKLFLDNEEVKWKENS